MEPWLTQTGAAHVLKLVFSACLACFYSPLNDDGVVYILGSKQCRSFQAIKHPSLQPILDPALLRNTN